jgi:hypothetical protein
MNALLLLTCILAIAPQVYDKPSTTVDIIEINHFWSEANSTRKLDGKEVGYGKLIFDQVLLWQLDEQINKYRLIHWELIKDGRKEHQIVYPKDATGEEMNTIRAAERLKIYKEWEEHHRNFARYNHVDSDSFIVYIDSPWLGPKSWKNKPVYNTLLGVYEMYMDNDIRILAKTCIETNTTYDPDISYRNQFDVRPGDTKLLNSFQPYFDRKYKK